jgi:phage shock protein PspC (stress-responsive transcriptional regulator)
LYRDAERRVIGGVCGGLAAYFNMDPAILRIIMVV